MKPLRRTDRARGAAARIVLERCDELATISALPDGFIERTYLTVEHKAANATVAEWMAEAGLATWQDAAGNVCGRLEGSRSGSPALLLGSHLDTVPRAGRYDGVLGVMIAIEVAARLRHAERALPFALEVIGFGDEEVVGPYGCGRREPARRVRRLRPRPGRDRTRGATA